MVKEIRVLFVIIKMILLYIVRGGKHGIITPKKYMTCLLKKFGRYVIQRRL